MPVRKNSTSKKIAESREQLIDDLQAVINDAQSLIKSSKDHVTEEIVSNTQEKVTEGMKKLQATREKTLEWGNDQMDQTTEQIRSNPIAAVGIAAGIGVLLGLTLSRR